MCVCIKRINRPTVSQILPIYKETIKRKAANTHLSMCSSPKRFFYVFVCPSVSLCGYVCVQWPYNNLHTSVAMAICVCNNKLTEIYLYLHNMSDPNSISFSLLCSVHPFVWLFNWNAFTIQPMTGH